METRASYLLVGLFVLALIAGAFAFLFWLAKAELRDERVYYYIYFRGAVTGLQVGSAVQFRGVPVGTVTDIAIDADNVELIQVTVGLKPGTPVRTDTVASLQLQGITGLSFVQLSGGTRAAEPLMPRPGKRRAVIPSVASPLERFFENAPDLVMRVGEVALRANELLSEDNLRKLSTILDNVDRLTGALVGSTGDIEGLIREGAALARDLRGTAKEIDRLAADASRTLSSYEALAGDLRGLSARVGDDVTRVSGRAEAALGELNDAIRTMNRLAGELEQLTIETRAPVRDFAQSGLYELGLFVVEARALVASLTRIAALVERDPARFFFGDQTRGVEAR